MLSKWVFEVAVQGVIGVLPASEAIHYHLERRVTRPRRYAPDELRSRLTTRLQDAARHMAFYHTHTGQAALPTAILEVGTGRFPCGPLALHLCGAEAVYTLDLNSLIPAEQFRAMLDVLVGLDDAELAALLPDLVPDRLAALRAFLAGTSKPAPEAVFDHCGITPLAAEPGRIPLNDEVLPLIVSTSTLEHVRPAMLGFYLQEFRRLITPDGLLSHFVNMADHYARVDGRITIYNFLRYTNSQWAVFNTPLLYQNRLRITDYRALYQAAGFDLVTEVSGGQDPAALERVPLAPQFLDYTRDDLLVTHAWLVATPADTHHGA